jgi:anti-anti-sigma factor
MLSGSGFPTSGAPWGDSNWARFGVHVDETVDGGCVVRAVGELDSATAELMRDALSLASQIAGDRLVVVDLGGLTFMNVGGIRALFATHQRSVGAGGAGLVVRGASGIVRRLFELTGLTVLLMDREPVSPSSDAAEDVQDSALELARRDAGLSVADLYVAYFALGGAADRGQLAAFLDGDAGALDRHQRDIAVHALNEHLIEVGRADQLLSYAST